MRINIHDISSSFFFLYRCTTSVEAVSQIRSNLEDPLLSYGGIEEGVTHANSYFPRLKSDILLLHIFSPGRTVSL